jgi:hypothetical protein
VLPEYTSVVARLSTRTVIGALDVTVESVVLVPLACSV